MALAKPAVSQIENEHLSAQPSSQRRYPGLKVTHMGISWLQYCFSRTSYNLYVSFQSWLGGFAGSRSSVSVQLALVPRASYHGIYPWDMGHLLMYCYLMGQCKTRWGNASASSTASGPQYASAASAGTRPLLLRQWQRCRARSTIMRSHYSSTIPPFLYSWSCRTCKQERRDPQKSTPMARGGKCRGLIIKK